MVVWLIATCCWPPCRHSEKLSLNILMIITIIIQIWGCYNWASRINHNHMNYNTTRCQLMEQTSTFWKQIPWIITFLWTKILKIVLGKESIKIIIIVALALTLLIFVTPILNVISLNALLLMFQQIFFWFSKQNSKL